MYQIETSRQVIQGADGAHRRGIPRVSRNVAFLGANSLLTDISSEMVSTILPLYLMFTLRLAPLQFGIIDGLYQGGSVLVRLAGGVVADRWERPRLVAATGYAISAVCKLGFLVVRGPWTALTGLILVDRIGKGIRTAPRDAIISLSTPTERLGIAFGVHRAMDTAGAMLGPLIAFGILYLAPDAFDAIFVVSFCFAILGLALLVLFVKDPPAAALSADEVVAGRRARRASLRAAAGLLNTPRLRGLVIAGSLLSLATVSDSFIYLALQDQLDFTMVFFPLLYVATALCYMVLAVPFGRLADRVGRWRVFVAGYVVLAAVYLLLLAPGFGVVQVVATLALFGSYYAMTDGVLVAHASTLIPAELRATGLGLLSSATSLGRLFGSILFGLAWTSSGMGAAVLLFLVGLVAAGVMGAFAVRTREVAHA